MEKVISQYNIFLHPTLGEKSQKQNINSISKIQSTDTEADRQRETERDRQTETERERVRSRIRKLYFTSIVV